MCSIFLVNGQTLASEMDQSEYSILKIETTADSAVDVFCENTAVLLNFCSNWTFQGQNTYDIDDDQIVGQSDLTELISGYGQRAEFPDGLFESLVIDFTGSGGTTFFESTDEMIIAFMQRTMWDEPSLEYTYSPNTWELTVIGSDKIMTHWVVVRL
jgi:hypothetical protein